MSNVKNLSDSKDVVDTRKVVARDLRELADAIEQGDALPVACFAFCFFPTTSRGLERVYRGANPFVISGSFFRAAMIQAQRVDERVEKA